MKGLNSLGKYLTTFAAIMAISGVSFANTTSHDAIKARLEPVGKVAVEKPAAQANEAATQKPAPTTQNNKGKEIYNKYCTVCHATGLAGAPKKGDEAAWKPRLKQGEKVLLEHVEKGINAMPPKGTCMSCTEDELKAAIKYMSGARSNSKKKVG